MIKKPAKLYSIFQFMLLIILSSVFSLSCSKNNDNSQTLFSAAKKPHVKTITMISLQNSFPIILKKKDAGNWELFFDEAVYYPAQDIICEELLVELTMRRKLSAIKFSNLEVYGIIPDTAIVLELHDSSDLLLESFIMGENISPFTDRYVFRTSDSSLFRITNNFDTYISFQTSFWTDLQLFSYLRSTEVISIAIKKDFWGSKKNDTALLEHVKEVLEPINAIDITNIPYQSEFFIRIETGKLTEHEFSISSAYNKVYILTTSSNNASYSISEQNYTNILNLIKNRLI